jgi:type IV secretion system protein VirB4
MAQFFRYPNAQVFAFDKGYSAYVLTSAAGGNHYDLGLDDISFCPFSLIDRDAERLWAHDWLELLLRLQNVALLPEYRKALWRALELLASSPASARTITDLINTVQEHALRDALGRYSVTGPLGRFLMPTRTGSMAADFRPLRSRHSCRWANKCFCLCSPICFMRSTGGSMVGRRSSCSMKRG